MVTVYVFKEFEHEVALRLALQGVSYILDRATTSYPGPYSEVYANNVKIVGLGARDLNLEARMRYYGFQRHLSQKNITRIRDRHLRSIVMNGDTITVHLKVIQQPVVTSYWNSTLVYMYAPIRTPLYYATLKQLKR